MESVSVTTAQNVDIEYEIASVGDRILAALIDYLILLLYVLASVVLMSLVSGIGNENPAFAVTMIILIYLPLFLYDFLCEIFLDGQSFGKMYRKIRVVKLDGSQPSVGNYLLRWILRPIDISFTYGSVAILAILINGRGQRVGDIAAGTAVIKIGVAATLHDTIHANIEGDYTIKFPEVDRLSDDDIYVIKEILNAEFSTESNKVRDQLLRKGKIAISNKMKISNGMPARAFLEKVLKDYNFHFGKL